MLEISHLRYDVTAEDGSDLGILRDVSLTVSDGKLVVITGPNGGGKTTLARAIMGLNQPTGGAIRWNGQDITNLSVTDRARAGVSYGFQQPPRFKGMKVRNLIALAAGKEDLTPTGGEVKRIEIATILARKAGLMIFDEPEAGIDLWSFARLTETFETIHKTGNSTLLIISHQERIIRLADEIVVIEQGQVAKHGPRDEIFPQIMARTLPGCGYMREGDR